MADLGSIKIKTHSHLSDNQELYQDIRDFLDNRVVNEKHLIAYQTEIEEDKKTLTLGYKQRLSRSYNINITRPVVSQHESTIGSQERNLEIKGEPENWGLVEQDATGKGQSFEEFFSAQIEEYLSVGIVGVLIEAPQQQFESKAEEIKNKARPFFRLFAPEAIRYYRRSDEPGRGSLFQELILELEPRILDNGKKERIFRRYYFQDGSKFYNVQHLSAPAHAFDHQVKDDQIDLKIFDEIEGELLQRSEIPFVITGEGPKESSVIDVYCLNHALFNRVSVLSNVLDKQGFYRSVITGVKEEEPGLSQISENIFNWVSNPNAKVFNLPPGEATGLFEEIRLIMNWANKIGMKRFSQIVSDDTRQQQSAPSKEKDLQALERYYNKVVNKFEHTIKTSIAIALTFFDKELSFDAAIESVNFSIERDFGLIDREQDLKNDFFVWQLASDMGDAGFEIKKTILKKYTQLMIIPRDRKKKLIEKIDTQNDAGPTSSIARPNVGNIFDRQTRINPDATNARTE